MAGQMEHSISLLLQHRSQGLSTARKKRSRQCYQWHRCSQAESMGCEQRTILITFLKFFGYTVGIAVTYFALLATIVVFSRAWLEH
jgi:hypothetical protein